jgi:hypothetical protein
VATWQVLGAISCAAVLAAHLNYIHRVDRLIRKHDGFSLGFVTPIYGLGFHYIDKAHPRYPQAMNQELQLLRGHRLILIVAIVIFAGFVLFGAASRMLS